MSASVVWEGWTVERKIGEGSFGTVYEISRTEFGKTYRSALKVVTIPRDDDEVQEVYDYGMDEKSISDYFYRYVEDIAKEIQLMSDLQGFTNIVSYQDHKVISHEDGVHWDIMIRMELLSPLTKQVLSEKEVIKLGIDICNALEICRQRQILHRDIKPQNIFVNEHGDYKIGDFGIARTIERTVSSLSQKGTYDYMAPEVFLGRKYGHTADLYSLAVVMYKYLNDNRLPFLPQKGPIHPHDKEKALDQKMSGMPVPLAATGSKELNAILKKALSFNPEDRYQTAEEFRYALKRLGDTEAKSNHSRNEAMPYVDKKEEKSKPGNSSTDEAEADEKTIFLTPTGELKNKSEGHTDQIIDIKKKTPILKMLLLAVLAAAVGVTIFLNMDKIRALSGSAGNNTTIPEETEAVEGMVRIIIPEGFEKVDETDFDEEYLKNLSRITLKIQESASLEADRAVIESITADDLLESYKEQFNASEIDDLSVSLIYYSDSRIEGCPARVVEAKVTDSKEVDIRLYQIVMITDKIYTWSLYDIDGTNRNAFAECMDSVYISD